MYAQLLLGCISLLLLTPSTAQNDPIQRFIETHQTLQTSSSVDLSGFVLDFAMHKEEGKQSSTSLRSRLTRLRVWSVEEGVTVPTGDILALRQALQAHDFEPLITIRKGSELIDVLLRENEAGITDVLLLINGENDDFTLLNIQGLLRYEDLRELNLDVEGSEELKELPAERPRV